MTIENDRDLEDYLKTLLDFSNHEHIQFFEKYKVIRTFNKKSDEEPNNETRRPSEHSPESKSPVNTCIYLHTYTYILKLSALLMLRKLLYEWVQFNVFKQY